MNKCEKKQYARAYIVLQKYENLFNISSAFKAGTIFRDLYDPYKKSEKSCGRKY